MSCRDKRPARGTGGDPQALTYDCECSRILSAQKIGLLGGSFDPIHRGHLNIAASACEEYGLSEVWFIPTGHSPNKDESEMTSAEHRAAMVSLAIRDDSRFRLSRIEIDAAETSYTYRTLTKLTELYPETEFYFIMGADSLDYLDKWRNPRIICEKATILVAARDDLMIPQMREKIAAIQRLFPARICLLRGGYTDVSSTMLRRYIGADPERFAAPAEGAEGIARGSHPGTPSVSASDENAGVGELLPGAVAEYIRKHGLYGYREAVDGEAESVETS